MPRRLNILPAATIIMLMALASRILGLFRERLLVSFFGRTLESDVYRAAFVIPDSLFDILVFAALSVSFIPVFTSYLSKQNRARAFAFANTLITMFMLTFGAIALVLFLIVPWLAPFVIPGIVEEHPESVTLYSNLVRLMLVGQVFFVLSGFLTSILHSFQRFFIPAIAAVLYNVSIIGGIFLLAPSFGIYGPTIGVVVGFLLHLGIQIPLALKLGFSYRFRFDIHDAGFRETLRLMGPRVMTAGLLRLGDIAFVHIASLIAIGSYTVYNIAFILQSVPVGLFGLSIAQAALPALSTSFAEKKMDEFRRIIVTSFRQILFLVIPASAMLISLRIPITRLTYGAKTFTWEGTVLTGETISLFSLSLFTQALVLLFSRCFYAMHDSVTPVKTIFFSVPLTIGLGILFVFGLEWNVTGLALAFSIGSIAHATVLFFALHRAVEGFSYRTLLLPSAKIAIAGLVMALGLRVLMKQLDLVVFDTTRTINLIYLTGSVSAIGLSLYLLLAWTLRVEELQQIFALFRRLTGWRRTLRETEELIEPQQK